MYAGWAHLTVHKLLYACSLYIGRHTLTGCPVGKYTNINRSCSHDHQVTSPFGESYWWTCDCLLHPPGNQFWVHEWHAGADLFREKTTLYNFGADVCHTNLAAFVKYTSRVVVPCYDTYSLCLQFGIYYRCLSVKFECKYRSAWICLNGESTPCIPWQWLSLLRASTQCTVYKVRRGLPGVQFSFTD